MPVKIKGNEYSTVAERLNSVHDDHDYISITTEIVDETQEYITIKANVSIHNDSFEQIYSGHAREYFELRNRDSVNFAFALENAETSAIGRALASAGYGGKKFASAEEMSRIEAKTKARESQIPHGSAPLLQVVEDARQQADISVDQLKKKSQNLFGTNDIRALSGVQLKRIANEISNGKN